MSSTGRLRHTGWMPVACKCCTNPKREEINKLILSSGASDGQIAATYGMSREAVRRHRNNHLSFSPQAASDSHNVATIVGFAHDLFKRSNLVLERAETMLESDDASSRSVQAAAASLREVRASIELLAKLIVSGDQPAESSSKDAALDASIGQAIALLTLPALGSGPAIVDAEIVAEIE